MNTKEWQSFHENQSWSEEGDYVKTGVLIGVLFALTLFLITL